MTREQYLAEFAKHLRVAKPKRSEIIAELKTHLDQLGADSNPITGFGDPKTLARQYNRTHIGFFSSAARVYTTPFAVIALQILTGIAVRSINSSRNLGNDLPLPDASAGGMFLIAIFTIGTSVAIGIAASRTKDGWRMLRRVALVTFFLVAALDLRTYLTEETVRFGFEPTVYGVLFSPYLIAGVVTLVLLAIASLTSVGLTAPDHRFRNPRTGRRFEVLLYGFVTVLIFLFTLSFGEFLAPYDTVPQEMRPPYPNLGRTVNDVFETPIAAIVVSVTVAWLFARRLRRRSSDQKTTRIT